MAELVTIRNINDPVEAQMLVDLLDQEGIVAMIPGNEHNAMMGGLLAGALNVPLRVPADDAERARDILAALDDYDEVDPEDAAPSAPDVSGRGGGGPYRGGTDAPTLNPRKPTVAVAAALMFPLFILAFGAGHFYARSYGRGFVLLAVAWGCAALALASDQGALFLAIPLVVLADIVGAVSLIRRQNAA